jgi:Nitrate and nitrite sensing
VPAVAFLVIGGVLINSTVQRATELDQFAEGVKVGREFTALIHVLQAERDHTAGVLARAAAGGPSDPVSIGAELTADYSYTDSALADYVRAAGTLRGNSLFQRTSSAVTDDVRQLGLIREGVKSRWLRQSAVFDQYTTMISHFFDLIPTRSDISDADSARALAALTTLGEIKELTAELRGRVFAAASAGVFNPDDFASFAEIQARQQATIDRFRSLATPESIARYDDALRGAAVSNATRLLQQVIGLARGTTVKVNAEEWWRASTTQLELLRYVEQSLLENAIDTATARSAVERRNAFAVTSVIVLIMLAAMLLSWSIGRSMARSLRELRAQALDVAQHRLPEAINRLRTLPRGETITVDTTNRVRSFDEIGEVADAFSAVHRSAVSLAVEQAVMRRNVNAMFVNLARRSQTLVERQLQLLDTLEAAETDPDQLANLFRLDHLATRMRRNDENLLVLAGSETARRWAQPVSLAAVALAAMAEIEQYARIRHDVASDVYVVGHAVSDIVHLLAELLENATSFSPPDSVVTVNGWAGQGGHEATIVIEDRGMGMSETGVVEANSRVASPVPIDVASSERMGLVVVGHLAARHGVRVRLRANDDGVVAHVTLPANLLAAPPEIEFRGLYGAATGRLPGVVRLPIAATANSAPEDDQTRATAALPAPAAKRLPVDVPTTTGQSAWPPVEVGPADATGVLAPVKATAQVPVSSPPVSSPPVSGVPAQVSGPPVSGPPVSGPPVSGPPVQISGPPAAGANGAPSGRRGPSRAENIIGAAARGNAAASTKGTRWWSRGGGDAPNEPTSQPLAIPVQREPVIAGTSGAGLPIRVPMAQLPVTGETTQPIVAPTQVPRGEPDPAEVSNMLTRFYSGVHRAASEDDVPTVPIQEHRGVRRDAEPTST